MLERVYFKALNLHLGLVGYTILRSPVPGAYLNFGEGYDTVAPPKDDICLLVHVSDHSAVPFGGNNWNSIHVS